MQDNSIENLTNELKGFLGKELKNICSELQIKGRTSDSKFPLLHSWIFEKDKRSKKELFVIYELFSTMTRKSIYYFLDEENCKSIFYDTDRYRIDKETNSLVDFIPYR